MSKAFVLLLFFSSILVIQAQIYQRAFFYFTDNSQTNVTLNYTIAINDIAVRNCSCQNSVQNAFSCILYPVSVNYPIVGITPSPTGGGGVCNLKLEKTGETTIEAGKLAFFESFSLSPFARSMSGSISTFNVTTNPTISSADFDAVFSGTLTVRPLSIPDLILQNVGTRTQFQLSSVDKTNIANAIQIQQMKRLVDLELIQTLDGSQARFTISRPLVLYEVPTLVNVEPRLVRINDRKQFTVTCQANQSFTDTTTVLAQFGSNPLISTGMLSGLTQFVTTQNISSGTTGTKYDVKFSLDRDNYHSTPGITVQVFEFPATTSKTITGGSFPGFCNIFSLGTTVTFEITSSLITEQGYTPMLSVADAQFQRKSNCSWVGNKVECLCVEIWDMEVLLPQSFKYALNLNQRDWYLSDSFNGSQIQYAKPNTFAIYPLGKFGSDNITSIRIFNITDRFDLDRYNYEFRFHLPSVVTPYRALSCVPNALSKEFNCSFTNTDLSYLCCNGNSISSTSCFPSGHCTLNVALVMGRKTDGKLATNVEFLSEAPFQVYSYFTNNIISVAPQSIPVGESRTINITAWNGILVNPSLIKYRLNATDRAQTVEGSFTYYSSSLVAFYVDTTISSVPSVFDLFVTLNGLTYERFQLQDFRVYTPNIISFTAFYGSVGAHATTKPIVGNATILGTNFYPSTQILIRYYDSNMDLPIQPCIYVNSSAISCLTPNLIRLGLDLPMNFTFKVAFNGIDFLPNSVSFIFEKSDKPIIVQVVPQRGPFYYNGTDPYSITVKGITKSVERCLFKQAVSSQDDPLDLSMPHGETPASTIDGEVRCDVPVNQPTFQQGNASTPWKLYLYDGTTKQYSDPFTYQFYIDPVYTGFSPTEGNAYGREEIFIHGIDFMSDIFYYISLRLDETVSNTRCKSISSTTLSCITPAHKEGPVKLMISFNDYQYKQVTFGNDTTTLFEVLPCGPGNTSKIFNVQCTGCPIGQYKPLPGFFECIECERARYQPLSGQPYCMKCPTFTTTQQINSIHLSQCDCEPGYFRPNGTQSGIDCKQCPSGGDCRGGGSLPTPQPGYWWDQGRYAADRTFVFALCSIPEACALNSTYGVTDGCNPGYRGYICGTCQRDYYKSGLLCKKCDNDARSRFAAVIIVIIVIVLFAFKFAQLKVTHLSSLSIAVSYFQLIAVFSMYNFGWPDVLKSAFNVFKFFVLDMEIFVPECISEITYQDKYGFTISIPAIFLGIIIILFFIELIRTLLAMQLRRILRDKIDYWFALNRKNWYTYQLTDLRRSLAFALVVPLNFQEMKDFLDKLIHTFVVIISFSYVFVVTKAAEVFNCETVNGVQIMKANTQQKCEGDYYAYFVFSIIVLVLFGGGVMVVFAIIVFNRSAIVKNRAFNNRFRFLFIRFKNDRLFWEIVIIIRKLLISMAIIFFGRYPMLVVLFAMLVMFAAFILQIHYLPYRRHFHNIMEYFVLLTCEFLLFCGLLFYVDDFPNDWNRNFLGYLCIVVAVGNTVIIGLLILLDLISQLREERAEKLKKRAEKQGALDKMEQARKDNDSTSMSTNSGSSWRRKKSGKKITENDAPASAAPTPVAPEAPALINDPNAQAIVVDAIVIPPTPTSPSQPLAPTPSDQPAPKQPNADADTDAELDDDSDFDYEEEEAAAPWAMLLEHGEDDVKLREYMQNVVITEDDKDSLLDKAVDMLNVLIAKWEVAKQKVLHFVKTKIVIRLKHEKEQMRREKEEKERRERELEEMKVAEATATPSAPMEPQQNTITDFDPQPLPLPIEPPRHQSFAITTQQPPQDFM